MAIQAPLIGHATQVSVCSLVVAMAARARIGCAIDLAGVVVRHRVTRLTALVAGGWAWLALLVGL